MQTSELMSQADKTGSAKALGEVAGKEWGRGKGGEEGRFRPYWASEDIWKESRFHSRCNGKLLESSFEGNDTVWFTHRKTTLMTVKNKN